MNDMRWKLPWTAINSAKELQGVQSELDKEIGPRHPLWGMHPQVIGRRVDCDDILVRTADGALAVVHLVWHGKIDSFPEKYPRTLLYRSDEEFCADMARDAEDLG